MATLNDIDWQQMQQQRKMQTQQTFVQDFMADMRNRGRAVNPQLGWDGSNLTFTSPGTKAMSSDDVWNLYVKAAESRGVKPDVFMFDNEILPYYKQQSSEQFQRQLGQLKMMNIPDSEWKKLYKTSSAYKSHLIDSIQGTDSPEDVMAMQALIPANEGQGLWENIKESPMTYGMGGMVTASAAKFAYDKMRASQALGGNLSGFAGKMKTMGPFLGAMAAPMAAQALGATEKEADVIGGVANVGVGGYLGAQGIGGIRANALAGSLADSNTLKTLRGRAKALGITEVDGKSISKVTNLDSIKKGIAEKVQGDGYRKTKSRLSKDKGSRQIFKNANKKYGGANKLKGFKGAKLPGWGSLAMAALTIPEIVSLTKTLFGNEPTSDDVDDYSPYQKQQTKTPEFRTW